MNRQLFYDQYKRSYSFFTNTPMAATGFPSESETKLLANLLKSPIYSSIQRPWVISRPPLNVGKRIT